MASDAAALHALLTGDDVEYGRHFVGLDADPEALARTLASARRDRYWGIVVDDALVGLIMLRGLDAGFEAPAFGVYVARQWSNRRLARLALAHAEA